MRKIEKTFEVRVPLRAAYGQWTQFEQFPQFMDGVKEVRRLDDTHLRWRARIAGVEREWLAEITAQVPGDVIAWRSTDGPPNAGAVRFKTVTPESTRVSLTVEYELQTAVEKAVDALGLVSSTIDRTVDEFKRLAEKRYRLALVQQAE
jgi:uncharacterized membrane protein